MKNDFDSSSVNVNLDNLYMIKSNYLEMNLTLH